MREHVAKGERVVTRGPHPHGQGHRAGAAAWLWPPRAICAEWDHLGVEAGQAPTQEDVSCRVPLQEWDRSGRARLGAVAHDQGQETPGAEAPMSPEDLELKLVGTGLS